LEKKTLKKSKQEIVVPWRKKKHQKKRLRQIVAAAAHTHPTTAAGQHPAHAFRAQTKKAVKLHKSCNLNPTVTKVTKIY
jgi:hypothetical protein